MSCLASSTPRSPPSRSVVCTAGPTSHRSSLINTARTSPAGVTSSAEERCFLCTSGGSPCRTSTRVFEAVDAELAHADLLVSHPAASVVGSMSCELRGVPWVVGDLFPMLVPTATAPPAGMPNLGATINRATWSVGRSRLAAPLTSRSGFVEFRDRLGLATTRSWNLIDARLSPHRNIALDLTALHRPSPGLARRIRPGRIHAMERTRRRTAGR